MTTAMPRLSGVRLSSPLFYILRRPASTSPLRLAVPLPATRSLTTTSSSPPGRKPAQWPRHFRSILYAIIFGLFGYHSIDRIVDQFAGPVYQPDTPEDQEAQRQIREQFDKLNIVKELRENPEFVEWEAYGNFSPEEKRKRLTTGGLRGSRALSSQRVFWNERDKTAISVLFLGNGIDGWPGVVHGGALAILLDEGMGRVALRCVPARTGLTANLNIDYRKPVLSGQFCTVTAKYVPEKSNDRKAAIKGEIRDSMGRLCTEASALFVVPRTLTLRKLGDGF
ncbi:thioesterase [Coccidioides immitis RS]|uniref:Thioesterase n=2 Tax=Coccidioides immitis TaxID=5501 RepID=J3K6Y3_COCIM|nr:thioesterase [Coccidioides immitis RS]EAS30384.3 thioesterase [Coccidioides immitis RS]KMP02926.1 hypothetical protein CIRG_02618 [Coccidioides immitis RMSCC 2394]